MKINISIFKAIQRIFSPDYIYTIDKSINYKTENYWFFKEFGTQTYVKKTYEQLINSDFFREVNPKDIAFIAETEARKKLIDTKLSISEETRCGVYTITNGNNEITVTGKEFMKDRELIDNTAGVDATRIAFYTGLRKGREISNKLAQQKPSDHKFNQPLKLVK
ncbi:hypothetical protein [Photorhabdus sp. RM323S]|uniref:hypothetical protein n=1 Tax=Photorhabdus sp. RM323S TaxID=3342828 RepID=UPI0036DA0628